MNYRIKGLIYLVYFFIEIIVFFVLLGEVIVVWVLFFEVGVESIFGGYCVLFLMI